MQYTITVKLPLKNPLLFNLHQITQTVVRLFNEMTLSSYDYTHHLAFNCAD